MSSNAIGTGAVILSANADKLASGLDKAAKDVAVFAAKADKAAAKAGGGKKGGLLGSLFGGLGGAGFAGGIAGAAVGVVAGAVGKAVDFMYDLFTGLEERAAKVQLTPDVREGVGRVDMQVRQLSNTWDTLLLTAVAKLAPLFERAVPALEAVMYVAEGVFETVVDGVGHVLESIGQWVDSTFGLGVMTNSAGDTMFNVFKTVGKAVGYVYDTVMAIGGGVVWVAGSVVKAFGSVVDVIAKATQQLAELVAQLPEALQPGWVQDAANVTKKWGNDIEKIGDKLKNWGKGKILNWGETAKQLGEWVDKVKAKFDARVRVAAEIKADPDPFKLAGAFDRGSVDAYKITARNQVANNGLNPNSPERLQLMALGQIRELLRVIAESVKGAQHLQVIG